MAAMGLLDRLRWAADAPAQQGAVADYVLSYPASTISTMPAEVAAAFGLSTSSTTVTRKEAMSVPAVRRARQMIAGTLGTAPLVATDPTRRRVAVPIIDRPDPEVTRSYAITWTVDDLLFHGVSWWLRTTEDAAGYPTTATRIPPGRYTIDKAARTLRVDGRLVNPDALIRFDAPAEGVLASSAGVLRTAIMLDEAVRRYARLDVPLGLIVDEGGSLTETEVTTLLNSWETARAARTTGYLPRGLRYEAAVLNPKQLELGDARMLSAVEVARIFNLPSPAVNAPAGDSLTYATSESNRRELVDLTLAPYMTAITDRLTSPDLTRPGLTVAFDLARFLRGTHSEVVTAAAAAVSNGLVTVDEARALWLDLPPMTGPTP